MKSPVIPIRCSPEDVKRIDALGELFKINRTAVLRRGLALLYESAFPDENERTLSEADQARLARAENQRKRQSVPGAGKKAISGKAVVSRGGKAKRGARSAEVESGGKLENVEHGSNPGAAVRYLKLRKLPGLRRT